MSLPILYTVAQVAKRYGLSQPTVYDAIHSGRLRAVRLTDHRYRLSAESVQAWIHSCEAFETDAEEDREPTLPFLKVAP